VQDDVSFGSGPSWSRESNTESVRYRAARRVDVNELDFAAGYARSEPGNQTAYTARSDYGYPIAWPQLRVPHGIHSGFKVCGEHGAARWNSVGD